MFLYSFFWLDINLPDSSVGKKVYSFIITAQPVLGIIFYISK